jgi:hypothetical protein
MIPSYLLYIGKDKAVFRSWDNKTFEIDNHPNTGFNHDK